MVGMQNDTVNLKKFKVSFKNKQMLTVQSNNSTSMYLPKEIKTYIHIKTK